MSDWTKDRDEAARRMVKTAREAGNTYPGSFGGALEGAVAEIDRLTTELARWTAPIDVDAEVMREADVAWSRHREICDRLGPASSSVWPYVVRPHVEREARLRREVDRLTTELASRTKAATDWRDTAERHLARAEVAERGLAAIRRAAEPEPFEKIEQLPPTPAFVLFGLAMAALAACCTYLYRGELPPPWLAFSTCGAVLVVAALAIVHAWRQS